MSPAELEILAELVAQRVVLQLSQRGMLTAASRSAQRKEAQCVEEEYTDHIPSKDDGEGWPQSVLEGAQWKRAELVPADPFADPPRSYSQDNDLP